MHLGALDSFYNRPDAYSIRDVNLRLVHQSLYQAFPSVRMRRRTRVDEGVVKRRSARTMEFRPSLSPLFVIHRGGGGSSGDN